MPHLPRVLALILLSAWCDAALGEWGEPGLETGGKGSVRAFLVSSWDLLRGGESGSQALGQGGKKEVKTEGRESETFGRRLIWLECETWKGEEWRQCPCGVGTGA